MPSTTVCCLSHDQTAVGGGWQPLYSDNYLDLLANKWQEERGTVGGLTPLPYAVSHFRPNLSNGRGERPLI